MAEHTELLPTRVEIRADPIVVERPTSPPSHIPCTLNLFFDSEAKTAFLKLRLPIATDQQEDQSMYLFVWPEQITSIARQVAHDPDISLLCKTSRGGTNRLHIELNKAGSVVGPQTWPPSTASRLDAQARHDLEWLGKQTQLSIHISRRAMSAAQLQTFCTAIGIPGLLKASAIHADAAQMYGGQGGKIIEDFSSVVGDHRTNDDENDISTQSGSPPTYDEAAAEPSVGPFGSSPGPEQRPSHKPSLKRRRQSSSPEWGPALADIRDPLRFFENICNKVWEERQACLQDKILTELGRAEARIMQSVEEQISQLQNELTDHKEQADENTATIAGDLIDEAFDDKIISAKVELEDFIKEELCDVETSIWDQLEAGTWETSFLRRRETH